MKRTTYLLIAMSLGLAWPAMAIAQAERTRGGGAKEASGESRSAWHEQLIDLDFSGGTVGEYVDIIKTQVSAEAANIIFSSKEARAVELPPIELKSVVVAQAMGLIEGHYPTGPHTGWELVVEPLPGRESIVFRITAHRVGAYPQVGTQVWTVADLLEAGIAAEDVLSAVETAIELHSDGGDGPPIRFHESTALLITTGTPDQLDAIRRVIKGLREGVHQRQQAAQAAAGVEGLFEWIMEMRKFDGELTPPPGEPGADDGSSSRGAASLLRVLQERIDAQARKIRELEKRIEELASKE